MAQQARNKDPSDNRLSREQHLQLMRLSQHKEGVEHTGRCGFCSGHWDYEFELELQTKRLKEKELQEKNLKEAFVTDQRISGLRSKFLSTVTDKDAIAWFEEDDIDRNDRLSTSKNIEREHARDWASATRWESMNRPENEPVLLAPCSHFPHGVVSLTRYSYVVVGRRDVAGYAPKCDCYRYK